MSEQRFTVTITETGTKRGLLPKRWTVVGTDDNGQPTHGYTPETETVVSYDRKVYEQTVEVLNIVAVIDAVNSTKGGAE